MFVVVSLTAEAEAADLHRKRIADSFKTHQNLPRKNSRFDPRQVRFSSYNVLAQSAAGHRRSVTLETHGASRKFGKSSKIASTIIIDFRQLHMGIKLLSMESSNWWGRRCIDMEYLLKLQIYRWIGIDPTINCIFGSALHYNSYISP